LQYQKIFWKNYLKILDAHNFYFCVLALLVVEDMQIGFVDMGKSVFMCW